jgi:SRSO17 transposase
VLGVNAAHPFNPRVGEPAVAGTAAGIARDLDPAARKRLSAGEGTRGARLSDRVYLGLADLDAAEYGGDATRIWTRGPPIRRDIADGERAFFTTWRPAGTTIEALVAVEGQRRAIEDSFETAKNELGLDHNETVRGIASDPGTAGTATPRW